MWYNLDKINRDRQTYECDLPPMINFTYTMKYPWAEVMTAHLTKYQFETKATLSNIIDV